VFVFGWASYMQIELTPREPKTQKIKDLLIGNQARLVVNMINAQTE
jgi:hypothetical protein